jgi:hypothetical protein
MIKREEAKRSVGQGWHGLIDEFYDNCPIAVVTQVKEKYGSLCIYHDIGTEYSLDLELDIRERSSLMCEECGGPCESRNIRGWIWTLCDEHAKIKEENKS